MKFYTLSESEVVIVTGLVEQYTVGNGVLKKSSHDVSTLEERDADISIMGLLGEAANAADDIVVNKDAIKNLYCAVQESI